jgi:glycosyltransferase involved in cell wall biosynthesis
MRLVSEEHVLVADDAASFAAAVLRVYADDGLWKRLSENARRHLEGNFSTEAVRPLVARLFPTGTPGVMPPGR